MKQQTLNMTYSGAEHETNLDLRNFNPNPRILQSLGPIKSSKSPGLSALVCRKNIRQSFQKPTDMDNIKATTEQLRAEAAIQRKKVSEVSKELLEFCEKNKTNDMLVSGPADQHNPFQEKKSCSVL
ncbi:unnamed protein product [Caenorhabditis sp. 36 PRJEB53466]|nr:unnamed protein product [Caenorhabditis sp. 36 PRJEB53466]